jgi:hypothetical protein
MEKRRGATKLGMFFSGRKRARRIPLAQSGKRR